MNFTNLKYSNVEHNVISADVGGQKMSIPVAEGNTHYDEIVEQELEIAAYIEPEKSWEVRRIEAYASTGDQLDMQYHDAVDGTTTWKDHVAVVKAAHPKP
tara:strand:+ start:465 stop:764 length:300 start_codon:yes stop_codon:yes gene_type:complete